MVRILLAILVLFTLAYYVVWPGAVIPPVAHNCEVRFPEPAIFQPSPPRFWAL